jgi:HAD superfamily hydrolase (TIGR01450 family)
MSERTPDLAGRDWVALDLDGVVYQGSAALPGAAAAVGALCDAGLHTYFVTNASGATRAQVVAKLERLGVHAVEAQVTTSAHAAARFARHMLPAGQPVLLLGSPGLAAECAAEDVDVTDDPQLAAAVVVGLDVSFSHARLAAALVALNRGVPLVGCNRDASYPGAAGVHLPGCGPLLAAVEAASGRRADAVVGKPGPTMLTDLWAQTGTSDRDWFVVGDTDSDIGMANAAGVPGVLLGDPDGGYRDLADFTHALLAGRHVSTGIPQRTARESGSMVCRPQRPFPPRDAATAV